MAEKNYIKNVFKGEKLTVEEYTKKWIELINNLESGRSFGNGTKEEKA